MNFSRAVELFSKDRLASYEFDIKQHRKNLNLIGSIAHKLGFIEIVLRNQLDRLMCLKVGDDWISKVYSQMVDSKLSHSQNISRLSLGNIISIIHKQKLLSEIMNLKDMDFVKYDKYNRNFYRKNGIKHKFSNKDKVKISLDLLKTLRNRSFHWENILKIRSNNGHISPRITTEIHNVWIGLHPDNINIFLDDLLREFGNDLLKYVNER